MRTALLVEMLSPQEPTERNVASAYSGDVIEVSLIRDPEESTRKLWIRFGQRILGSLPSQSSFLGSSLTDNVIESVLERDSRIGKPSRRPIGLCSQRYSNGDSETLLRKRIGEESSRLQTRKHENTGQCWFDFEPVWFPYVFSWVLRE